MTKDMRVLVCGGRDFQDWGMVCNVLDELHAKHSFTHLIEGGARGADELAGQWATIRSVPVTVVAADWKTHGKKAGPIRNRKMLDLAPDLVVAFPGGAGTADMMRAADSAGVRVIDVSRARND